jgi:hypothetical protein
VIREPYTLPPQEEEEPDCSELFAPVLKDFAIYLQVDDVRSLMMRAAAIQVATGTMTPIQASRHYGVRRDNIYRNIKLLCKRLGLTYQAGRMK